MKKKFLESIRKFKPDIEVVAWAESQETFLDIYNCDRGDRLLWLASRWDINRKRLVAAACDCAELVLVKHEKLHPEDNRPRKAIETARDWINNKATLDEVAAAAAAAKDAYDGASAFDAAFAADTDPTDAAAVAISAAYSGVYAAYAAANSVAADAADYAAADYAAHDPYYPSNVVDVADIPGYITGHIDDHDDMNKQCAEIFRKHFTLEDIESPKLK